MTDSQSRDVIDVLTSDHREFMDLIQDIWAANDAEMRRDLTDTMISELVRHAVAEEMYVYPAMKKHLPDGKKAVEHDVEEHKELEVLAKRLEDVDADVYGAEFSESLRRLEAVLADHIQDEENEQFPELRRHIPADELVKLAEKVENAKKVAPTRPHPHAPNNELFHKLVGPGVGLIDRLRDRLANRQEG